MSPDDQKFMATDGLVQWLAAAVTQGQRLRDIYQRDFHKLADLPPLERRVLILRSHTEATFLASAANQILKYRKWTQDLGLLSKVDFSELDKFDAKKIRDLRNMREHVIEYFLGQGDNQQRWFVETPEYKADASAVVGAMIGGRLDYEAFTTACEVVLQEVLSTT
jgi:hypothetical protein